ncbi:hypothetical protein M427DRAFT_363490 [Gonapodya prolifera JEL478]|uniref:Uncharacterized protein n=1 Tax=Gonapodya prolifera (strain JEL478) TaxID=1344416 RepID=A0A139AAT9_GONPJ|nr:hypothetical protein M427DRAFT_363490 [Gonapodya prolifera JEL478]|eukprot:KXS13769.1 hypothetical protein M427DRAFT_363490 [Gonapodya prolifera JEL478]
MKTSKMAAEDWTHARSAIAPQHHHPHAKALLRHHPFLHNEIARSNRPYRVKSQGLHRLGPGTSKLCHRSVLYIHSRSLEYMHFL